MAVQALSRTKMMVTGEVVPVPQAIDPLSAVFPGEHNRGESRTGATDADIGLPGRAKGATGYAGL
jgi:hypothetical protein